MLRRVRSCRCSRWPNNEELRGKMKEGRWRSGEEDCNWMDKGDRRVVVLKDSQKEDLKHFVDLMKRWKTLVIMKALLFVNLTGRSVVSCCLHFCVHRGRSFLVAFLNTQRLSSWIFPEMWSTLFLPPLQLTVQNNSMVELISETNIVNILSRRSRNWAIFRGFRLFDKLFDWKLRIAIVDLRTMKIRGKWSISTKFRFWKVIYSSKFLHSRAKGKDFSVV